MKHWRLRPISWLYVLVVLAPFTAAMPRGRLIPFLGLNDVLIVVGVILALLYVVLGRHQNSAPPFLMVAIAAFALGTVVVPIVAYAARGVALDVSGLFDLVSPLKYLLIFWIFAVVPVSPVERRRVVLLMAVAAASVAAIGLLQGAGVGGVVSSIEAWYPSGHVARAAEIGRITSVLGAWNSLGIFLMTVLLLIAATYLDEPNRRVRTVLAMSAAVGLVGLIATNLYSGLLSALLGFVVIKTADGRGLWLYVPIALIGLVGFLVLLPTVTDRAAAQFTGSSWIPQTLRFRYDVWVTHFLPAIAERPVWGVHPTFDRVFFPHPESQYVYLLYRSGAVSLVGHLVWLGATIAWLLGVRRAHGADGVARWDRSIALAAIVLILLFSLVGTINPVFTYTASMSYVWMLLGLVRSAQKEVRRAQV